MGTAPLFADFSSSIASEPIDVSRYGVIYAGAQKNLGPVGVSVVIIRKELLERSGQPRADIFDYRSHAERDSMLNTPPTWNWYLAGLVFKWMLAEGGVEAVSYTHLDVYKRQMHCHPWMRVMPWTRESCCAAWVASTMGAASPCLGPAWWEVHLTQTCR